MIQNHMFSLLFIMTLFPKYVIAEQYCFQGTRVVTVMGKGQDNCDFCPNGTFMPDKHHKYREYFNCTKLEDPMLEVLMTPCNRTTDTEIHCIPGYYRRRPRIIGQKGQCKPCTGCPYPFHEAAPCQTYANTHCCNDENYDVAINKDGVSVCRERPWLCRQGQYLDLKSYYCLPCPSNTYMSLHLHSMTECWKCQDTSEKSMPIHSRVIQACNTTHPTIIACEDGYFANTLMGFDKSDTGCALCTRCDINQGLYEGRGCDGFHDAVCCSKPNMTVIDNPEGPKCLPQMMDMLTGYECGEGECIHTDDSSNAISCKPCPSGTVVNRSHHTESASANNDLMPLTVSTQRGEHGETAHSTTTADDEAYWKWITTAATLVTLVLLISGTLTFAWFIKTKKNGDLQGSESGPCRSVTAPVTTTVVVNIESQRCQRSPPRSGTYNGNEECIVNLYCQGSAIHEEAKAGNEGAHGTVSAEEEKEEENEGMYGNANAAEKLKKEGTCTTANAVENTQIKHAHNTIMKTENDEEKFDTACANGNAQNKDTPLSDSANTEVEVKNKELCDTANTEVDRQSNGLLDITTDVEAKNNELFDTANSEVEAKNTETFDIVNTDAKAKNSGLFDNAKAKEKAQNDDELCDSENTEVIVRADEMVCNPENPEVDAKHDEEVCNTADGELKLKSDKEMYEVPTNAEIKEVGDPVTAEEGEIEEEDWEIESVEETERNENMAYIGNTYEDSFTASLNVPLPIEDSGYHTGGQITTNIGITEGNRLKSHSVNVEKNLKGKRTSDNANAEDDPSEVSRALLPREGTRSTDARQRRRSNRRHYSRRYEWALRNAGIKL